jgi:hypothetical protein
MRTCHHILSLLIPDRDHVRLLTRPTTFTRAPDRDLPLDQGNGKHIGSNGKHISSQPTITKCRSKPVVVAKAPRYRRPARCCSLPMWRFAPLQKP